MVKNINELQKLAGSGDAKSQFELANHYRIGKIVPREPEKAFKWYLKSAKLGNTEAQNSVGACYAKGFGVCKDLCKTVLWLRKAAQQGNVKAQTSLGKCYLEGYGVSRDMNISLQWFLKAANQIDESESCQLLPKHKELLSLKNLEQLFASYNFEQARQYYQIHKDVVIACFYEILKEKYENEFRVKSSRAKKTLMRLLSNHKFDEAEKYYQSNRLFIPEKYYLQQREEEKDLYTNRKSNSAKSLSSKTILRPQQGPQRITRPGTGNAISHLP